MKALIVVDGHLVRTPDGKVWSSRIYNYSFFKRYLSAFNEIRVAIRMIDVETHEDYPHLCSGDGVEFFPIEEFRGPKEYIKKYMKIRRNALQSFDGCDCAIFRIPSTVGYQLMNLFKKTKKPYSIEVVIDPWDFAAPGMIKTPLRPIIRLIWTLYLKRACLKANGVSYVTKFALQNRYPSYSIKHGENKYKFDSYYSSVNLEKEYYNEPKIKKIPDKIKIIHVSNVIGNYVKGHKELIEAARKLILEDYDIEITFVGDGDYIELFEKLCKEYKIEDRVKFIGKISDKYELRSKLLESDIFIFPSHAEGLPRVLIEAMAVGLPCISTNINGIPELIENEWLVRVGEVDEIVEKFKEIFASQTVFNKVRNNNYKKALEYSEDVLQARRKDFYLKLKGLSKEYNKVVE